MTRKTYRTAQGKVVDLGALQLKNENVRAVGNMKVNARGDLIDGWNRPIDTRNQQVAKQYKKQTTNVTDTPISDTSEPKSSKPIKQQKASKTQAVSPPPPPPEDFDDDFQKPVQSAAPQPSAGTQQGGLAAAIAKAREIRQDPIQTPRELSQTKPGVSRI